MSGCVGENTGAKSIALLLDEYPKGDERVTRNEGWYEWIDRRECVCDNVREEMYKRNTQEEIYE